MQYQFKPQAIIAHRGDNAHAPENTLRSFRQALAKHTDGIELDVHLSADGEVVVMHDKHVNRTTNGEGAISALTLAELRELDAGEGETVPTLAEVLELLDEHTFLNIELKGTDKRLSAKVAHLVVESGKKDQVIYSSFAPTLLMALRKSLPDAKIGLLLLPGFNGKLVQTIYEPTMRPWSLNPHKSLVTKKFMKRAKRHGRRVFPYTIDRPKKIKRLLKMGVDGIITNDPETAIRVRAELQ